MSDTCRRPPPQRTVNLSRERPEQDPLSSLLNHPKDEPQSVTPTVSQPTLQAAHTLDPLPEEYKPVKTISEEVDLFLSGSAAEVSDPGSVACSIGGLRVLARMRAFQQIIVNSQKLMLEHPDMDDLHTFYYFSKFKLGSPPYLDLRVELEEFLKSKAVSSAIIGLRIFSFELMHYAEEERKESLECLSKLREEMRTQSKHGLQPVEAEIWARRATMSIVNLSLATNRHRVALAELQKLLSVTTHSAKQEILSRIGKIFLQQGDVGSAKKYFNQARLISTNENASVLLNDGLLWFAMNDYQKAAQCFLRVIRFEADQEQKSEFSFESEFLGLPQAVFSGIDVAPSHLTDGVNNYAISAMYACELTEAVMRLENLIKENPREHMLNSVVFNLCTLYELSCDNKVQTRKKSILKEIAKRFTLDDISPLSFRIS